jgi:hypothetical protein
MMRGSCILIGQDTIWVSPSGLSAGLRSMTPLHVHDAAFIQSA